MLMVALGAINAILSTSPGLSSLFSTLTMSFLFCFFEITSFATVYSENLEHVQGMTGQNMVDYRAVTDLLHVELFWTGSLGQDLDLSGGRWVSFLIPCL